MIFISNAQGTIQATLPSPIYQGSNLANEVVLIAPFAQTNQVDCAITLPNGARLLPILLTAVENFSAQGLTDSDGKNLSAWSADIPETVTEFSGDAQIQFRIYTSNQGISTSSTGFNIQKGVAPILPDSPTADVYNEILQTLANINEKLVLNTASAEAAAQSASEAQESAEAAAQSASEAQETISGFTTDKTLTISGKAADAKATGDRFKDVTSALLTGEKQIFFDWTNGSATGSAGDEVVFNTSALYAQRYKYIVLEGDYPYTCTVADGYILNIRIIDENNIITFRTDRQTSYDFLKGTRYAVTLQNADTTSIVDIDANSVVTMITHLDFGTGEIDKKIDALDADVTNAFLHGEKIVKQNWQNGQTTGQAGDELTVINDGIYAQRVKYVILDGEYAYSCTVADGYILNIRIIDENNIVTFRTDRHTSYNFLRGTRYAVNLQSTTAGTSIVDIDANSVVTMTAILDPVPYLYKTSTELTLLHTGDTSRRVQGGIAYGDYFWYGQPGRPETENSLLVKYNLVTNTVEKSVANFSYGHVGILCYNSDTNKLIIKEATGTAGTNILHTVNADTLDHESQYTVENLNLIALVYDPKKHHYICEIAEGGRYKIVFMDNNFQLFGEKYDLNITQAMINDLGSWQGICCDDDFLYLSFSRHEQGETRLIFYNAILIYEKRRFTYTACHSLDYAEEIECIGITNGKLYGMFDIGAGLYEIGRKFEWEI